MSRSDIDAAGCMVTYFSEVIFIVQLKINIGHMIILKINNT